MLAVSKKGTLDPANIYLLLNLKHLDALNYPSLFFNHKGARREPHFVRCLLASRFCTNSRLGIDAALLEATNHRSLQRHYRLPIWTRNVRSFV